VVGANVEFKIQSSRERLGPLFASLHPGLLITIVLSNVRRERGHLPLAFP